MTYADSTDKTLIRIGYLAAIITGLAMPSFVFIFGDIINSFGGTENTGLDAIKK